MDTAPRWLDAEQQHAWIGVAAMAIQLPGALDAQLQRDSGLSLFEYFVLSRLSMTSDQTLRMSALAELANGSLSRLSNVVKRLEQRGWVRRSPDPDDGRATVASLTPEGRRRVEEAAPGHVAEVRRLLIDVLNPEQLRAVGEAGAVVAATIRHGCPPPC
ncbi:DNA-binding MarR family transcriptional regulator [Friedmanniella endophytica]|uniref:DNA-binding MarR family transcriptional regulator n=1 Tax=Microlunatus kandeliicorticis TaxID=1759536 RepID=A0A7W3IQR5_9ACTN|nr:MarR family transcriptional regulator [Microlunatus kandeliicorticis]MBA8793519.1 DNA-binding MarR family transcriptional regulator [Microlunatus kandeliicorticis]